MHSCTEKLVLKWYGCPSHLFAADMDPRSAVDRTHCNGTLLFMRTREQCRQARAWPTTWATPFDGAILLASIVVDSQRHRGFHSIVIAKVAAGSVLVTLF